MSTSPSFNRWNNVISNINNFLPASNFIREPIYPLQSSVEYPREYPLASHYNISPNSNPAQPDLLNQNCSCRNEIQNLRNQFTSLSSQLNDKIDSLSNGNANYHLSSGDIIPYTEMMIKINEMQTHLNDLSSKVGCSNTKVDSLNNRIENMEHQQKSTLNTINNITNYSRPLTQNDVESIINNKLSPLEDKLNTLMSKVNEIERQQNNLNESLKEIGSLARYNSDHLKLLEIKCGNNSNSINETSVRVDSLIPTKAEKAEFIQFKNKQEKLNFNYQSNIQNLNEASDQLEEKIELVNQMGIKNAKISQTNFDVIDERLSNRNLLYNNSNANDEVVSVRNDLETLIQDLRNWKEQLEDKLDRVLEECNETIDTFNRYRDTNFSRQEQMDMNYCNLPSTNMTSNRRTDVSDNAWVLNSLDQKYAHKDDLDTLKNNIQQLEFKISSMNKQG